MYTVWAGEVDYETALRWQELLVKARQADQIDDVLLLLTHPPVYTAGRNAHVETNLTGTRSDIPVIRIDRGGDLTYHGPGQLVAYPIMRLAQRGASKRYVTALEQSLIDVLATYGLVASRRLDHPGVWIARQDGPPDKIAAIGVRLTMGVTKHGVALNVDPHMEDFDGIVPCGIVDGGVTSLAAAGVNTSMEDVRTRLAAGLCRALGRVGQSASPGDLGLLRLPRATMDTTSRMAT
jgi:lipoyl(octanoyl) transferase